MAKVRSARGVEVNFDEIKIKQQLVATPTPLEVKARQDFVETRLKRRAKRQAQKVADATTEAVEVVEPVEALDDEFEASNENEALPAELEKSDTGRKQRKPK